MTLPFLLRGDQHHGRVRKDGASPQSHTEAAFLTTGCPSPRTGTGLRDHVPLLILNMDCLHSPLMSCPI